MPTPKRNNRVLIVSCLLIACLQTVALASTEPVPFRATYTADYKGLPVSATGIRELTKLDDNRFMLSSTANSFFATIKEQSIFELDENNTAVPLEYQYHRKGIGKNRDAVLEFDWKNKSVLNNVKKKPWNMKIDLGVMDKLLYQYQMRADLKYAKTNNQPWPNLSYQVADRGKLKQYEFEILNEEAVETGIGDISTLKITRKRQAHDGRSTVFWLALNYDFMLVRFQQLKEDGSGFELLLDDAQFGGEAIEAD
ncbi:MAG: hypothetical protein ACJAVI_005008 [Candidatus Azotimanducaceae bacterium]|jgi:hypothetical protein